MYGLVNKAIQDLVTTKFGEAKWELIKADVGFNDDMFLSLKAYPDQLTYALVGSASRHLGMSADQIMEAFGEYWMMYTANEGYEEMLKLAGNSLPEFINNLDMLHNHVNNIMPELVPPQFNTRNEQPNSLELEYHSEREGLSPMVIGILKGLGKRFGHNDLQIEQIQSKKEGATFDVYRLNW